MKMTSLLKILFIVAISLAVNAPASAESPLILITDESFCMHVHSHPGYEKAFSQIPFGTFRTWDSGAVWPLIEPEKGKWNWDLLDNFVRLARENNIKLIFTLGMTPKWAAKNPDAPNPYGGNTSSSPPRDLADWENFIRKVAERNETVYGGAIRYWEVWNEPDNTQPGYLFYTGTIEELVGMARTAHSILKSVNSDNMIISPGITQIGQKWLDQFLKSGGVKYVDIITFHYYWAWNPPSFSDFEPTITSVKNIMEQNGCADKPLWLTETGFDVKNIKTQDKRNLALFTTLVAPRYYGAGLVCAYSWNGSVFTNLFDGETQKSTETAAAYIELHKWLDGASITNLKSGKVNSKVMTIEKNGRTDRIVWRYGAGKTAYKVDPSWGVHFLTLDGADLPIPSGGIIQLGNSPIIITGN
jgi:hypothetical protein